MINTLPENRNDELGFPGIKRAKVRYRNDPKHLGRVKVEVVGIHSPGEDPEFLPWSSPSRTAYKGGGEVNVPPVGSYVWVILQDGDHQYPTYFGGWWTEDTLPDRSEAKRGQRWNMKATGSFNGQSHSDGILKLDPKGKPEHAPDNFIWSSPIGKRLELDDRKGRQRVVLADDLDNGLFLNTERGSLSLEVHTGNMHEKTVVNGLILSTRGDLNGGFQLFNDLGWKITCAAEEDSKFIEMATPSGHIIRMNDRARTVELWTAGGHRVAMSDENQRIEVRSTGQRGIIIDDASGSLCLHGNNSGMYVLLSDTDNVVDIRSTGTLRLAATDLILAASGNIVIDGEVLGMQPGGYDTNPSIDRSFVDAKIPYREAAIFFVRPYEEGEQEEQ